MHHRLSCRCLVAVWRQVLLLCCVCFACKKNGKVNHKSSKANAKVSTITATKPVVSTEPPSPTTPLGRRKGTAYRSSNEGLKGGTAKMVQLKIPSYLDPESARRCEENTEASFEASLDIRRYSIERKYLKSSC